MIRVLLCVALSLSIIIISLSVICVCDMKSLLLPILNDPDINADGYQSITAHSFLYLIFTGMIEGLGDRLTVSFQKQSGVLQDVLFQRMLRLKMSLYSCLGSGNQKAADYRAMLTLHSLNTLIKAQLRPRTVTAQDKVQME